ncbi:MAG: TetR/AcrR family transcriptional regulator [Caldilineaceae bacterium]|nr:TetR/AcrR family transcriptional regulator [Caldilineaceae bacterium]
MMAGLEIVEEEGVDQFNLRAVARRVGVTHAAPYRHFADKDALLAAIAEHGFVLLGEEVSARLAVTLAPNAPLAGPALSVVATNQIIQMSRAYIHFAQLHPALFRLMFSRMVGQRTTYPSLYIAAKQSFRDLLAIIEVGQRSGELVQGASDELATALWGIMHGLAVLLIENQIPTATQLEQYPSTEEYTEVLLKRMLGGILRNPS